MDTTQVPEFKLAKVGKRRERKKAGFFWLNGGAGAGGFTGATGGVGAFLGTTIGKVLVLGLLGSLSVGAYNVGMSMSPGGKNGALSKPKLFDAKEKAGAGAANAIVGPAPASGLAMVEGSLDGKTPEQRAAEAAAAEAAAKAEAERKAQEEADAKKAAEEQAKKDAEEAEKAAKAQAAAVPEQVAAKDQKNPFTKKFGSLSSSLGGGHSGLAGGAGLSGGIGRSFSQMKIPAGFKGQSEKQTNQAAAKRVAAKRTAIHGHSGRAFRQLVASNRLGQAARNASTAETSAQAADNGFENNPGADQAITGGGAGQGGAGTGDSAPGGGTTGSGGNNSGPTGCGGDCSGGAPDPGPGVDKSPWFSEIKWAARLTVIASGLLIAAAIISMMTWPWCKAAAEIIGGVAAALGAVVLGLGVAITAKGGPGMMYTISGGLITAAGALVALNASSGMKGVAGISSTMITWGSIFGGLLSGASNIGGWDGDGTDKASGASSASSS